MGLPQYRQAFISADIDGCTLLELTTRVEELHCVLRGDVGISSVKERLTLLKCLPTEAETAKRKGAGRAQQYPIGSLEAVGQERPLNQTPSLSLSLSKPKADLGP